MNLRARRRECPRVINLTALIDVVFNLLIFFMVTTSFNHPTEISLDLPTAESGQPLRAEQTIELTIDAHGYYSLRGQALPDQDPQTLRVALQEAAEIARSQPLETNTPQEVVVIVNADGQASHQSVVTVMDAARQVGLTHLTFATRHQP